ncbi:MAG: bifunctional 4-hydroxy-2-oxoglutarate aldolase/2-dehydro-3-deoxy-phosphogluconate aldolase [Acidimicrobiales bacterium]|jgi:2-dehydro-3-deoxyphosphogluconate aldolase/(4S)-4-hydroxy-2-oxoglutarate aldolase
MSDITHAIGTMRLVPVIVINEEENAYPLAQALKAGGLPCAEITFRTAAAERCLRAMAADSEMLLGAGTVLNPEQVDRAVEAGARYIVTPGFSAEVVRACKANSIPIFPGVSTATELQMALEAGIEVVKVFPAEVIGGLGLLKALASPFSMMRFIPTGGISLSQLADYLAFPPVLAVGGSWIAPSSLITAKRFAEITELASQSVAVCQAAPASKEAGR